MNQIPQWDSEAASNLGVQRLPPPINGRSIKKSFPEGTRTCSLEGIVCCKKFVEGMAKAAAVLLLSVAHCVWLHFILIQRFPVWVISPLHFYASLDFRLLSHVGSGFFSPCL